MLENSISELPKPQPGGPPAGTVVPTGIAARVTKACKPSHHLKGITLREEETNYRII